MQEQEFQAIKNWEEMAVRKLYSDYHSTLREFKIKILPAAIELCDSSHFWGQWDRQTRTIRMSRQLLKKHSWFKVVGVLRHEMAHQLVDEDSKEPTDSHPPHHGEAFRQACKRLGVPAEFARASIDLQQNSLDWRQDPRDEGAEKLLEKVRKLLALASSNNEHEALAAMSRVRELYAKYHLEHATSHGHEDFVHVIINRRSSRLQNYERKIISILTGHFFVSVLMSYEYEAASAQTHRVIEIIGSRENVAMAEFVYHFLFQQAQSLLDEHVKQLGRKLSLKERNSFRLGILWGFSDKLKVRETAANTPVVSENVVNKALVIFKKDKRLANYIDQIYPGLRTERAKATYINSSFAAGETVGRKISLHKPVTSSAVRRGHLLMGGK